MKINTFTISLIKEENKNKLYSALQKWELYYCIEKPHCVVIGYIMV